MYCNIPQGIILLHAESKSCNSTGAARQSGQESWERQKQTFMSSPKKRNHVWIIRNPWIIRLHSPTFLLAARLDQGASELTAGDISNTYDYT